MVVCLLVLIWFNIQLKWGSINWLEALSTTDTMVLSSNPLKGTHLKALNRINIWRHSLRDSSLCRLTRRFNAVNEGLHLLLDYSNLTRFFLKILYLQSLLTFTEPVDIYRACWHLQELVDIYRSLLTFTGACWHLQEPVDIYRACWHLQSLLTFTEPVDIYRVCWHLQEPVDIYRSLLTFTVPVDIYSACWHLQSLLTKVYFLFLLDLPFCFLRIPYRLYRCKSCQVKTSNIAIRAWRKLHKKSSTNWLTHNAKWNIREEHSTDLVFRNRFCRHRWRWSENKI